MSFQVNAFQKDAFQVLRHLDENLTAFQVNAFQNDAFQVLLEAQTIVQESLGDNQKRHYPVLFRKPRRVPTAEEVYRQAVNPPPPPLADVPALADIPGEVDREIAYRMRALEAEQMADRVARQATKNRLAAELKAAQLKQEEEDAIMAIMTMILMDEAA